MTFLSGVVHAREMLLILHKRLSCPTRSRAPPAFFFGFTTKIFFFVLQHIHAYIDEKINENGSLRSRWIFNFLKKQWNRFRSKKVSPKYIGTLIISKSAEKGVCMFVSVCLSVCVCAVRSFLLLTHELTLLTLHFITTQHTLATQPTSAYITLHIYIYIYIYIYRKIG